MGAREKEGKTSSGFDSPTKTTTTTTVGVKSSRFGKSKPKTDASEKENENEEKNATTESDQAESTDDKTASAEGTTNSKTTATTKTSTRKIGGSKLGGRSSRTGTSGSSSTAKASAGWTVGTKNKAYSWRAVLQFISGASTDEKLIAPFLKEQADTIWLGLDWFLPPNEGSKKKLEGGKVAWKGSDQSVTKEEIKFLIRLSEVLVS
eukprot:TRINITY_DN3764_c2_g1_i1.p1 TRINITY_DN3764_c2_g1~~TRINITY_DN3764_c2_g1_i1.p1  ORF type:complete len:206 (-),score=59.68 TRINITY_DN3764_c2_g1_i1:8-625(-)